MKTVIYTLLASSMLILPASAVEPVRGSLTFEQSGSSTMGQALAGSVIFNEVYHRGNRYREIYRVAPDGSLELINRTQAGD